MPILAKEMPVSFDEIRAGELTLDKAEERSVRHACWPIKRETELSDKGPFQSGPFSRGVVQVVYRIDIYPFRTWFIAIWENEWEHVVRHLPNIHSAYIEISFLTAMHVNTNLHNTSAFKYEGLKGSQFNNISPQTMAESLY